MADKTPLTRANRSAPEEVAFLARLAAGLAHEIKNPLSTMAINLTLLQEDWERAASVRDDRGEPELTPREERSIRRINTLQREVRRLEQIVDDFRQFARGADLNRKPEDLGRVVQEMLDFVEPEDRAAGIRHHVEIPVSLPLVVLDEDRFREAFLNLLVNARQAMPEGGELIVRLSRAANFVQLAVTDTGMGMRPEQLEHCFDLYWSDKKGGTGLGLATVKRTVEEHGGAISVMSEEGRGTSFTIFLPLVVELTNTHAERESAATEEDGA